MRKIVPFLYLLGGSVEGSGVYQAIVQSMFIINYILNRDQI